MKIDTGTKVVVRVVSQEEIAKGGWKTLDGEEVWKISNSEEKYKYPSRYQKMNLGRRQDDEGEI